jgi:glycogen debranching enzyme
MTTSLTPAYHSVSEIVEACYAHLESNLVEGENYGLKYRYYKPANTKYGPHQWLWDSGFHMIVWARRNPENAIADLRTMLSLQQRDGFVSEINKWKGLLSRGERISGKFYSRPEFVDLTQMPVLAFALRSIWNATKDITLLREFVPKLVSYWTWWLRERDRDGDHLVSIIHPWESGIDASPCYDPVHRVHNPSYFRLYPKFMILNLKHKFLTKWNQQKILRREWFNVKDVGVNSVYAAGWGILADLAATYDESLAKQCRARQVECERAILHKCWNRRLGRFVSIYHKWGQEWVTPIETIQVLMPLVLDTIPGQIQESILKSQILDEKKFWTPYVFPSVAYSEPTFNPHSSRLLWRGPVWPSTVWIVMQGLLKHQHRTLANRILDNWVALYMKSGVWEYYNPINGQGLGENGLGMSATIVDALAELKRI